MIIVVFVQFFASGLAQRGEDDEGFDGFLIKDIKKEISRSKRLVSHTSYPYYIPREPRIVCEDKEKAKRKKRTLNFFSTCLTFPLPLFCPWVSKDIVIKTFIRIV